MVGDVASALDSLGVKYKVVKGELSDVVWAEATPEATQDAEGPTSAASGATELKEGVGSAAAASASDVPPSPALSSPSTSGPASIVNGVLRQNTPDVYSEGQLCVRLRIEPDSAEPEAQSQLHISRHAGDVLQFHSFYRDFRNQLSGANGWVHNNGRYEHTAREP